MICKFRESLLQPSVQHHMIAPDQLLYHNCVTDSVVHISPSVTWICPISQLDESQGQRHWISRTIAPSFCSVKRPLHSFWVGSSWYSHQQKHFALLCLQNFVTAGLEDNISRLQNWEKFFEPWASLLEQSKKYGALLCTQLYQCLQFSFESSFNAVPQLLQH